MQNDQGRRNYNRLEILLFASRVGHKWSWIAADKVVVETLHIEEGYSAPWRCFEKSTAVVHTVVDSHYTLVVEDDFVYSVNAVETEHTERAADTAQIDRKVQAGGNLKIADNAGIVDEMTKGRCSGVAASEAVVAAATEWPSHQIFDPLNFKMNYDWWMS